MKIKIVEIPELSGLACKIYSIAYDGSEDTLFDIFQDSMDKDYADEVDLIWYALEFMGKEGGARIQFFREDEGKPGDGIVALLKKKKYPLRLYCIKSGNCTLILGRGGYKPPSIRTWQDDPHLSECVQELMWISSLMTEKVKNKEIRYGNDGSLIGDLEFELEQDNED